jgi:hypothetical protein
LLSCIDLAYACIKVYDIPVRKWITNKVSPKKEH